MSLPEGYEWACPARSDVWGVRRVGADRMLCGDVFSWRRSQVGFCPAVQPVDPSPQCGRCLAKLRDMA